MLQDLPVELLHDIQLLALSEHLPFTSKRLHQIFQGSSPLYRAKYIYFRLWNVLDESEIITKALRYPCCDITVLDTLRTLLKRTRTSTSSQLDRVEHPTPPSPQKKEPSKEKNFRRLYYFDIPRRLFKSLLSRPASSPAWTEEDHPLPFLRHLFDTFQGDDTDLRPNPNSNNGYGLTKAVHVQSIPLIRYLLSQGASPKMKDALAVIVAIRQKNLSLVKMLVERTDDSSSSTNKKRRKLEDRVKPDAKMLKVAVQSKARDITEWLCHEKGVVPDMQTLQMMM